MIREMLESLKEKNEMMWSIIILAGVGAGLGGFFVCMMNSAKSTSIWLTVGWAVLMTLFILLFLYTMDVAFKQWHKDQKKRRREVNPSPGKLLEREMCEKIDDGKHTVWKRTVLFKSVSRSGEQILLKIKNHEGHPVGVYIDDECIMFVELEENTVTTA